MGFFDNLKSSLTETGQDLSQKAKDTTEIFRLTNLNKTKEKEIEKVIYQIGSTYYANYRDECMEKMPELAAQIKSLQDEIYFIQNRIIKDLAEKGSCVIVGRCADYILRERKDVLNIFIYADMESKMERAVTYFGLEKENVSAILKKKDKARSNHYK